MSAEPIYDKALAAINGSLINHLFDGSSNSIRLFISRVGPLFEADSTKLFTSIEVSSIL